MCFKPIFSFATFYDEGHGELNNVLHGFFDTFFEFNHFFRVGIKQKFVVNLEYHFAAESLLFQHVAYFYHRHFDDVGTGALYGGVDGIPLCKISDVGVV